MNKHAPAWREIHRPAISLRPEVEGIRLLPFDVRCRAFTTGDLICVLRHPLLLAYIFWGRHRGEGEFFSGPVKEVENDRDEGKE